MTVDIPSAPGVPGPISGTTNSSDGIVNLSWSAATGNVTSYELERSNGASWDVTNYPSTTLIHNDTGLLPGLYTYRVRACDIAGCSAYTEEFPVRVSFGPEELAVQHFQYDELGRLKVYSADNSSYVDYQYDDAGNRLFVRDDSGVLDTDNDGDINSVDIDDDNDLMPDNWEVQNGFNPLNASDADDDPDNDGLTNLQEYQGGTDPLPE